jgi:nucleotide-binding universal stress UspA family protein
MVPYIHRGPLKLDRILICWDGGRPAARAVHDAMPFLRRAKAIDIVSVNEDSATVGEASSEALQTHLARHDLSVEVQRTTADTANIFNVILSLAADKNTDLIVMGGYGHSKFREFVLGGVTRGIFVSLNPGVDLALKLCRRAPALKPICVLFSLPGQCPVRS